MELNQIAEPGFAESFDNGGGAELKAFKTECNKRSILKFLWDSPDHFGRLGAFFKGCATVELELSAEDEPSFVNFAPKMITPAKSQKIFEEICRKNLENFLSKYATCIKTFDASKLTKMRSLKRFRELESEYVEKNIDVVISWKNNESTVIMSALRDVVGIKMRRVECYVNHTIEITSHKARALRYCGIADEIRQNHEGVDILPAETSIAIVGPDPDAHEVEVELLKALNAIMKEKPSGLSEDVVQFLTEAFTKKSELLQIIQDKLENSHVTATIGVDDGDVCIWYKSAEHKEQYHRSVGMIKSLILSDSLKIHGGMQDVLKSQDWKHFHEKQTIGIHCGIYVKSNDKIAIVGMSSEVRKIKARVEGHLHENEITKIVLSVNGGKLQFMLEKSGNLSKEAFAKTGVKHNWENGLLTLEARRQVLNKVDSEVKNLLKRIIESPLELDDLGTKEHYQSEEGRTFLSTVESENNCVIWIEPDERSNATAGNPDKFGTSKRGGYKSMRKYNGEKLATATLPNTAVIFKVYKTDIELHKCDAVFCACDQNLRLLQDGVTGVIKQCDEANGGKIQSEMNTIASKGNFSPGDVFAASTGNIIECQQAVALHVVLPGWSDHTIDAEHVLKACVTRGLKRADADKMKSVAIPAIPCGHRSISDSVPTIVAAVHEYFKNEKHSNIEKIHFVENGDREVLEAFVKHVNESFEQRKKVPVLKSLRRKSKTAKHGTQQASIDSDSSKKCPSVNLIEGDLAQQQTDVIVTVTKPGDLQSPPEESVRKSVFELLKMETEEEIENLSASFKHLGNVFPTSAVGLSCKELYHGLISRHKPPDSIHHVCSVVSRSLKMADLSKHSSISITPVGLDQNLFYPPILVARLMRQEILKSRGENLEAVTIVIPPGKPEIKEAFENEFNFTGDNDQSLQPIEFSTLGDEQQSLWTGKITRAISSRRREQNLFSVILDAHTTVLGKILISISRGSVTEKPCDILVNMVNEEFDLLEGDIPEEIFKKGGRDIHNELQSANARSGRSRVASGLIETSGGKLPCKKILHLIRPKNQKQLEEKLIQVFRRVRNSAESVAFSDFGVDGAKVPGIMKKVVKNLASSDSLQSRLNTVHIVTRNEVTLLQFQKVFCPHKTEGNIVSGLYRKTKEIPGIFKRFVSSAPTESEKTNETFEMLFYSTDRDGIEKAKECVRNETDRVIVTEDSKDDEIRRFSEWENYELANAEKRNRVTITDFSDEFFVKIQIKGMRRGVTKTKDDLKNIIIDFRAAEERSRYVTWEERTDIGEWKALHHRAAYVLERHYEAKENEEKGEVQFPHFVDGNIAQRTFDLSTLETDGAEIRRKVKEVSKEDLPTYWEDMKGRLSIKVSLLPTSSEYQDVLSSFQAKGTFHRTIVSIERIQNVPLYKQYAAKKSEVTEKLRNSGMLIEQKLFHGTSDDEKIIQHGFDRSYAGKNATVYGKGVYFATNANYSHQYVSENSQGYRRMFLADVVTGHYCVGNSSVVAPPPKRNSQIPNDLYDSVVDNETSPSIFVIFKDASAYPSYRITYV